MRAGAAVMAKISALDAVDGKLRAFLTARLRPVDEAVVLPQAHLSVESGLPKNVVLKFSGEEAGLDPDIFSTDWYVGVSVVKLDTAKTEAALNSTPRAKLLEKLVSAISSEMAHSDTKIGPNLDAGADDRDTEDWTDGFDTDSCCVGIYYSLERFADFKKRGTSRAEKLYYLVAKAGAGIAGQTFHARLASSLKQGATLDEALSASGTPGEKALRRVKSAAKRNRARLLVRAAGLLGLDIDTVSDTSASIRSQNRQAIAQVDVCTNGIERMETENGKSAWMYTSGCTDSRASVGALVSSNVADGFVMLTHGESLATDVRNEAGNSLPFASARITSNRELILEATARAKKGEPHHDAKWIDDHFAWNNKKFDNIADSRVEPPSLLGSHEPESFLSVWSRELGLSHARFVKLNPDLVCVSGVEPGRLRVALKEIAK